jgi:UDP-2,3-diacylglucosamine hydrolase
MDNTLFIADLHLTAAQPQLLNTCVDFLRYTASKASKLYILGDLFEVWLGDDAVETAYLPIIKALSSLKAEVFFMPGNRDFLLGAEMAATMQMELISTEYQLIDLYGIPTLIMHGDSLCSDDLAYQNFRAQVRNPNWQQQFLAQPIAQRQFLANQARLHSQTANQHKNEMIMDVNQLAVANLMQQQQVKNLIHGHTHRPGIYEVELPGQLGQRYVLGSWQQAGQILHCTPNKWQLISINSI